ncbi:MAG: hypothetical protein AAGU78_17270 [Chloroflexota bacterium]
MSISDWTRSRPRVSAWQPSAQVLAEHTRLGLKRRPAFPGDRPLIVPNSV